MMALASLRSITRSFVKTEIIKKKKVIVNKSKKNFVISIGNLKKNVIVNK